MKVHSETKIGQIKELRLKGYSINEIVDALSVPKTTVWHHIQGLVLPPLIKKSLSSKRGGGAIRTKKEWDKADAWAHQILIGDNAKLAIAATMLYWGEGGKKACDITNTDPKLLLLYLKFLYQVVNINPFDIKISLRIFTGMHPEECLIYWANSLNLDPNRFIIRYNDGGVSGKAKHGICRITLKKGSRILKLMHSLIRLSFSDIMGFNPPLPRWIEYQRPLNQIVV